MRDEELENWRKQRDAFEKATKALEYAVTSQSAAPNIPHQAEKTSDPDDIVKIGSRVKRILDRHDAQKANSLAMLVWQTSQREREEKEKLVKKLFELKHTVTMLLAAAKREDHTGFVYWKSYTEGLIG